MDFIKQVSLHLRKRLKRLTRDMYDMESGNYNKLKRQTAQVKNHLKNKKA